MGDMNDWPKSDKEDMSVKTFALIFHGDGTVSAERSRFGAFTIDDLKRMNLYDKVFSGD